LLHGMLEILIDILITRSNLMPALTCIPDPFFMHHELFLSS
jgi:hypothetical protein